MKINSKVLKYEPNSTSSNQNITPDNILDKSKNIFDNNFKGLKNLIEDKINGSILNTKLSGLRRNNTKTSIMQPDFLKPKVQLEKIPKKPCNNKHLLFLKFLVSFFNFHK